MLYSITYYYYSKKIDKSLSSSLTDSSVAIQHNFYAITIPPPELFLPQATLTMIVTTIFPKYLIRDPDHSLTQRSCRPMCARVCAISFCLSLSFSHVTIKKSKNKEECPHTMCLHAVSAEEEAIKLHNHTSSWQKIYGETCSKRFPNLFQWYLL